MACLNKLIITNELECSAVREIFAPREQHMPMHHASPKWAKNAGRNWACRTIPARFPANTLFSLHGKNADNTEKSGR
jgi:hypothetical protein